MVPIAFASPKLVSGTLGPVWQYMLLGVSVLETWKKDKQSCSGFLFHQKQVPFFEFQPPLTPTDTLQPYPPYVCLEYRLVTASFHSHRRDSAVPARMTAPSHLPTRTPYPHPEPGGGLSR